MDPFAFPPTRRPPRRRAYGALTGLSDLLTPIAGASPLAPRGRARQPCWCGRCSSPVGISQAKAEQNKGRASPR